MCTYKPAAPNNKVCLYLNIEHARPLVAKCVQEIIIANHAPKFIYVLISDMRLTASVFTAKLGALIRLQWYVPNNLWVWYVETL